MSKIKFDMPTTFSASIDYSSGVKLSNLISKFKVRVLYTGKNNNNSYFTKEVVDRMVETIGGIPIVGQYSEDRGDFLSHGELVLSIQNNEIKQKRVGTTPYGFVPPGAPTWYEEHLDKDGVVRNYLTTEAYLWTGRFPELETLADGLNNQSMELNPDTISGEVVDMDGKKLYLVSHAEFHGLCILGKGVDPCFEGAGFNQAVNFEKNPQFNEILDSMKQEFINFSAVEKEEQTLEEKLTNVEEVLDEVTEVVSEENNEVSEEVVEETVFEETEESEEEVVEEGEVDVEPTDEELAHIEEEEVISEEDLNITEEELEDLAELNQDLDYEALRTENETLRARIAEYEAKELRANKEALFASMAGEISDEESAQIFERLDSLDLSELKVELTAAAYRSMKSIIESNNFARKINEESSEDNLSAAALTYSFKSETAPKEGTLPEWVRRVKEVQSK